MTEVRPGAEGRAPLTLTMAPRRRGKPPQHFADLAPEERGPSVAALGAKAFRAKQLATHYYTHLTSDPAEMTDLPQADREGFVAQLFPPLLRSIRTLEADGGTTVKTLWRLYDDVKVESVLMRYPGRSTLCVSSVYVGGVPLAATFAPSTNARSAPWVTAAFTWSVWV